MEEVAFFSDIYFFDNIFHPLLYNHTGKNQISPSSWEFRFPTIFLKKRVEVGTTHIFMSKISLKQKIQKIRLEHN